MKKEKNKKTQKEFHFILPPAGKKNKIPTMVYFNQAALESIRSEYSVSKELLPQKGVQIQLTPIPQPTGGASGVLICLEEGKLGENCRPFLSGKSTKGNLIFYCECENKISTPTHPRKGGKPIPVELPKPPSCSIVFNQRNQTFYCQKTGECQGKCEFKLFENEGKYTLACVCGE